MIGELNRIYKQFVDAWEIIMNISERFEELFKFRFECNETVTISVTENIVKKKEFVLGHLVFGENPPFASTLIVLDSVIPKFNNLFASQFEKGVMENLEEVSFKNMGTDKLKFLTDDQVQNMIFRYGVVDTKLEKQDKVIYDFKKVQEKLHRKVRRGLRRVIFEKDKLKFYRTFGQTEGIGESIDKFKNVSKQSEQTPGFKSMSRKIEKFKYRLSNNTEYDRKMLMEYYGALSVIMGKRSSKKTEIDGNKSIRNFVRENSIFMYWDYQPLKDFTFACVYPIFESVEEKLVEHLFIPKLNPLFQGEGDEVDKFKVDQLLIDVNNEHKEGVLKCLQLLICRHSNSLTEAIAETEMKQYLEFSEVSEEFEDLAREDSLIRLFEESGLKVKDIVYFYKVLTETCDEF